MEKEKKIINGKEFFVKRDEGGKWIGHEPVEKEPGEFFIIKKQMPFGPLGEECDTVACKLILPTVSSYGVDE